MKKIYLFALGLISTGAFAQTLTSTMIPVAGDKVITQTVNSAGVSEGSAGSGQTWDFSAVTDSGAVDTIMYVLPSSTPYAASFTSSNLAVTTDNANYTYLTTSGSDIQLNGSGNATIAPVYSNPEMLFTFPTSLGTTFNDNFSGNYTASGFPVLRTGTIDYNADASGALTTPTGTYGSVLRIKTTEITKDSANVLGTAVVTNITKTSYTFYAPGDKRPLMAINYITTVSPQGTSSAKLVAYAKDMATGVEDITSTQSYNVFTSNGTVNASFNNLSASYSINIYNSLGQQVKTLSRKGVNQGMVHEKLDVNTLSAGVYFVQINSGDKTFTKKVFIN